MQTQLTSDSKLVQLNKHESLVSEQPRISSLVEFWSEEDSAGPHFSFVRAIVGSNGVSERLVLKMSKSDEN